MRISDWSSDVCSSDLDAIAVPIAFLADLLEVPAIVHEEIHVLKLAHRGGPAVESALSMLDGHIGRGVGFACVMLILEDLEFDPAIGMLETDEALTEAHARLRSEEHTSELQSLMRISYAVFCLKKKKKNTHTHNNL